MRELIPTPPSPPGPLAPLTSLIMVSGQCCICFCGTQYLRFHWLCRRTLRENVRAPRAACSWETVSVWRRIAPHPCPYDSLGLGLGKFEWCRFQRVGWQHQGQLPGTFGSTGDSSQGPPAAFGRKVISSPPCMWRFGVDFLQSLS